MIFNFKRECFFTIIILMTTVFTSTSYVLAEAPDSGLDISADHGELNLQTSIRRLEGNVLLKHLLMENLLKYNLPLIIILNGLSLVALRLSLNKI